MQTLNTTKLTNSELMGMHDELFAEEREARTLANISRRAARLWEDGYTAQEFFPGNFWMHSPQHQVYLVRVLPYAYDCTCPCFAKHDTCKHLEAVAAMMEARAQEAAQEAEYEALYAHAEAPTGCDAYARY